MLLIPDYAMNTARVSNAPPRLLETAGTCGATHAITKNAVLFNSHRALRRYVTEAYTR